MRAVILTENADPLETWSCQLSVTLEKHFRAADLCSFQPCAGAMQIFSVSYQIHRMVLEENRHCDTATWKSAVRISSSTLWENVQQACSREARRHVRRWGLCETQRDQHLSRCKSSVQKRPSACIRPRIATKRPWRGVQCLYTAPGCRRWEPSA